MADRRTTRPRRTTARGAAIGLLAVLLALAGAALALPTPASAAAQAVCPPWFAMGGLTAAHEQVVDVASSDDGTVVAWALHDSNDGTYDVYRWSGGPTETVLAGTTSRPDIAISGYGDDIFVTSAANPLGSNADGNRELGILGLIAVGLAIDDQRVAIQVGHAQPLLEGPFALHILEGAARLEFRGPLAIATSESARHAASSLAG